MNQTMNHSLGKKLLAMLLVLIMVVSVLPLSILAEEVSSLSSDTNADLSGKASDGTFRIVMLDCGRKYFSVDNIKKLIDTMSQYGYTQLQLSFGNGGCRFLLDDMSLSFDSTILSSNTVKNNITAGNEAFNGDTRYLSQSDMDTIIAYANSKKIDIVPMLNMPGHAKAIVYGTSYSDNDNLNVNNETSRNYGYALLQKYVDYFKDKGCKYFHFGSDESGYTGTNMTTFLTGCAKVITDAGMTPRAFNDATSVATMPTSVQITYWHKESGSQTASSLNSNGYSLINTHGRWYYVIKTNQGNSEEGTKYYNTSINGTATSVELPVMKAEKMDSYWVGIKEFFDGNPRYGSTIENSLGTMFCIWCDASEDKYLTDSQVISENENYGALYQLEKMAEHYWPDDINKDNGSADNSVPVIKVNGENVNGTLTLAKKETATLSVGKTATWESSDESVVSLSATTSTATLSTTVTGESVAATAVGAGTATITANTGSSVSTLSVTVSEDGSVDVTLEIGETEKFENITADAGSYITDNKKYLATAEVNTITTSGETKYELVTDSTLAAGTYYVSTSANATAPTVQLTVEKDGSTYYLKNSNGTYIYPNASYSLFSWSYSLGTGSQTAVTVSKSGTGYNVSKDYTYSGYWASNTTSYLTLSGSSFGASDTATTLYLYKQTTTVGTSTSDLTITGVGEGTTTVTVGGTTYNITVTAPTTTASKTLAHGESFTPTGTDVTITSGADVVSIVDGKVVAGTTDGTATVTSVIKNAGGYVTTHYTYSVTVIKADLSKVNPLNVQLWITNTWVGGNEAPSSLQSVNINASDAYSESGVLLKNFVPETGYKKDGSNSVKVTYWKGSVVSTQPVQQGADLSGSGDDFTLVRYWNNEWQYYGENGWTNVGSNYVIAYYLQINNVSPEITTGTKDYGNPPTSDPGGNSGNGFAMTAFAVVYPDGTLSRTEQQMYETGMMRGFWGSTEFGIGVVFAENNSTYKISKMTVTWGTNITGNLYRYGWYTESQTGTYGTDWGVKWNKVTNSAGDEWYDETTYWQAGDSEIPTIDGDKFNLKFNTTDHHAVLILIYLETVETDDSLNVIYWDDSMNVQINPKDIFIDVKNGTTFINGLKQTSKVNAGTFTLDDDATIENSSGVAQKINKNITIIDGVAANYKSGIYEYVSAEISEDGKTLTLHYNIKKVDNKESYVVDFGLPVTIPNVLATLTNITDFSTVEYFGVSVAGGLTGGTTGTYGNVTITKQANGDYSITYTLKNMLVSQITIPVYYTIKGMAQQVASIVIIPASTVYYEDSFATTTNGTGAASGAIWSIDGTTAKAEQALEELGKAENIYGYDTAYDSFNKFSLGSAMKVTVTKAMADAWADGSAWPTVKFTFKGTGFDVISLTDNDSGLITYDIVNSKGEKIDSRFVNNYYGYKFENGTWATTKDENALYQIPVIKVDDLAYDTYTVTISVAYGSFFDETGDNQYSFWMDAVRVYNPLGTTADETYKEDNEGWPLFIELHDALVNSGDNYSAVLIEGKTDATLAEYTAFGPNHEVYLAPDQSLAFKLSNSDSKIAKVSIGVKSVDGTAKYKINSGAETTVSTATDMYYDITAVAKDGTVIITNTGSTILSLTTVKVTFESNPGKDDSVTLSMTKEEAQAAVYAVRAMFAPVIETFEPERFEASWKFSTVYAGQKATLTVKTSEDVEAVIVNGEIIDTYRTRTVRTGRGSSAKTVTYREFTYSTVATESADYVISAVNADGIESEAIAASLTVKQPAQLSEIRNWINNIINRWF